MGHRHLVCLVLNLEFQVEIARRSLFPEMKRQWAQHLTHLYPRHDSRNLMTDTFSFLKSLVADRYGENTIHSHSNLTYLTQFTVD
jgi:hypothetical protein